MDVLQNTEASIIHVHRNHPLVDYDVMEALEALIAFYKRIEQGKEVSVPNLSDRAMQVFAAMCDACELRMGKESLDPKLGKLPAESRLCSANEIIACLKRILKSVNKWNKHYGQQGYLNFVGKYIK
jgi:hypothetical protein